ncbi:hypothetical protein B7463_g6896, partial [Scytalidium lignicola]
MSNSQYTRLERLGIDDEVRNEGFSVLWNSADADADIVFLHGLQGHPEKTWCFGHSRTNNHCFWPRDILPRNFPKCRILTYGYDSHISHFFSGPANQTSIVGHAKSLLNDLESIRQEEKDRPIIFIAHSLGGLLLKEALRQAWQDDEEGDIHHIYESTMSAMFLGTPHRGSDLAEWGLILQKAVKAVRFDASDILLRDLRIDSATLDTLTDGFSKAYERRHFQIFTFREGQSLRIPSVSKTKVVKDVSATLGYAREIVDTINADHRNMCRFGSMSDQGYRKIKNALDKSMKALPGGIDGSRFRTALSDLDSAETRWRLQQVEPAFQGTFQWLFQNPELGFVDWLESEHGLYWIKGKPASGKSTLLKMAYVDHRTENSQSILKQRGFKCSTAAFFFHDRGSPTQKSFEGLLKAIIHRILTDIPELKPVVHKAWRQRLPRKNQHFTWTVEHLIVVFEKIIQQDILDVSILLFLDALDEYGGKYQDMVQFLERVFRATDRSPRTKVKVCATSRPEQIFLDNFIDVPGFWIHDHTTADIGMVVDIEFEANARLMRCLYHGTDDQKLAIMELRNKILSNAEGVFLWVRLILEELLTEFTDGASLEQIFDELTKLPTDLTKYYKYLVEKRIRQKYASETRIMFELVKCANRPMILSDFLLAFRFATQDNLDTRSTRITTTLDEAKRLIRSRCGGLVELRPLDPVVSLKTYENAPLMDSQPDDDTMGCIYDRTVLSDQKLRCYRVQFLHQTVKAFATASRTVTLEAQGQSESGYLYITKLCLLAIRDSAFDTTNISFQSDFIYYLRFTECNTSESLSRYLVQVDSSRVVKAITPWTSTHYLPSISDYTSLAILADLPRLLEERLPLESGDQTSKLFSLFCKYLERLWDKCPRQVATLLLKHSTCDDIVWNSVINFLKVVKRGESAVSLPNLRRMELLRLVLESGANPNIMIHIKNDMSNGWTPLDYAVGCYTISLDTLYNTRTEDLSRKEFYLHRLAVAQFLLNRGAKMSGAFRTSCNWQISAEAAHVVHDLGVPIDDRLPYPWNMLKHGSAGTGENVDSSLNAHLDNFYSIREVARENQATWLAYGAQQVYNAASWLFNVRHDKP